MDYINICGAGFVGGSLAFLCRNNDVPFTIYDIVKKEDIGQISTFTNIKSLIKSSELSNNINYYFVCVPTPPADDGGCNTDIVETVVKKIYEYSRKETVIMIKSTIKPGTTDILNEKYNKDKFGIFFTPEFLTERRANLDMYEAKFALIGTTQPKHNKPNQLTNQHLVKLFSRLYSHNGDINILVDSALLFEILKYTMNTYFATKITFFNEIYELCERCNVNYNELKGLFPLDNRIGEYGTIVPGPDARFSYNGSCLVKEIDAMVKLQEELGLSNEFIKCVQKRGRDFRKTP